MKRVRSNFFKKEVILVLLFERENITLIVAVLLIQDFFAIGIDEITVDMKAKKIMVIGTVDPVTVVSKLRKKNWATDIISVGPAKDPPKKEEEPKKDGEKKEDGKEEAKKDDPKKDEDKKDEPKKDEDKKKAEQELVVGMAMPYRPYYPPMNTYYYAHHSIEENPNACAIC